MMNHFIGLVLPTDKLYRKKRYDALHQELLQRGYNVTHIWPDALPKYAILGDYSPTEKALAINRERIKERLPKNAYWGKVKSKAWLSVVNKTQEVVDSVKK